MNAKQKKPAAAPVKTTGPNYGHEPSPYYAKAKKATRVDNEGVVETDFDREWDKSHG